LADPLAKPAAFRMSLPMNGGGVRARWMGRDPAWRSVMINGAVSWVITLAGNLSAYIAYRPFAPRLLVDGWGVFVGALLAFWALLMAAALIGPELPPDYERRLARQRLILEVWTWLTVIGVILMLMPFGSAELQLVTLLFVTCYAATTVISSADQPDTLILRISVVLGSVILVIVLEQLPYWPFVVAFLSIFGMSLYALARLLERNLGSLREARASAEASLAARTRFLASASHDLGQPLQSARLFLDQVVRSDDKAARAAAARHADTAFGAMERLLRSMLDHLRLDAQAVEARPEPVSANDLIAHVSAQIEPMARLAGVRLVAVGSTAKVLADPGLFGRALGNLADNAVRHSDGTRVLIGARRHRGRVRFWVIDDGVGVAGEDAPNIFDEFAQGGQHGRERGGFGLGLATVSRLAKLMGGHAGLDTKWCKGAAFFVDLPAA